MFTGIIIAKGKVAEVRNEGKGKRVVIESEKQIELKEGDSIAIDGVCITVERVKNRKFEIFLSQETLKNTKFGKVIKKNYKVNLELPLKPTDRFGGHFVTGHVDGIGKVGRIKKRGKEMEIEIEIGKNFEKYLYPKASISVDGISLTLQKKGKNRALFTIIPYTCENTTISLKKRGDLVNLEFDVLAKIVENLLKEEIKR